MARPEAWRLDPAAYPFASSVQTRWGDMDMLGHINNVAMAMLFETARVDFNHEFDLPPGKRKARWLIARSAIDYVAEAHFPGDLEMRAGIGTIGRRSWQTLQAAFQNGVCVALADVILVYSAPGEEEMPVSLRDALEARRVTARVKAQVAVVPDTI